MATVAILRVTVPTNRTIKGPKLAHCNDHLVVDYDFEEDNGSITWGRVVFGEVLTFEYRDSSCCRAGDVSASTEIRSHEDSEYLKSATDRWNASVGNQTWQQDKGGRSRFRHFTVYFDDACCLNIIASSCAVVPSPLEAGSDDP
jgi:hypothetical protein